MEYKRWLIKSFVLTLAAMLVPAAFIAIVDPYSIYGLVTVKGLNGIKTEAYRRIHMVKAHQVYKIKPKTIVLGASPADYGIDMNDPAWPKETAPRYNYAIGGNSLRETLALLKYVHSVAPLKEVVIGLDFFSFNIYRANRDFMEKGFGYNKQNIIKEKLETLFSVDAINDSFSTILRQRNVERLEYDIQTGKRYLFSMEEGIERLDGQRSVMYYSATRTYINQLAGGQERVFGFVDKDESIFDVYRELISFSYENNINLKLFISPQHIILLETIKAYDLWSTYENWKETLAAIVKEEAIKFSKETFPVWDFATVNELTTESLPRHDIKTGIVMQYYLDSFHYTPKFGSIILNILYGSNEKSISSIRNLCTFAVAGSHAGLTLREYFSAERQKMKLYEKKNLLVLHELNREIKYYGGLQGID